ncbi:MAG: hypothetical protein HY662_02120, partial [Chloroflexi bacterium]|nr:hypothetical protein [Chloroflexota bacterium]
VATMALIWFTYFRVAYQMFRIPRASDVGDTNTRLVPTLAMFFVLTMGVVLLLMLLTGPHTHLHAIH